MLQVSRTGSHVPVGEHATGGAPLPSSIDTAHVVPPKQTNAIDLPTPLVNVHPANVLPGAGVFSHDPPENVRTAEFVPSEIVNTDGIGDPQHGVSTVPTQQSVQPSYSVTVVMRSP